MVPLNYGSFKLSYTDRGFFNWLWPKSIEALILYEIKFFISCNGDYLSIDQMKEKVGHKLIEHFNLHELNM